MHLILSWNKFILDDNEEEDDYDPTYDRVYSAMHRKMEQDSNKKEEDKEEKIKVVENPYYGSGELEKDDDLVVKAEEGEEKAAICQKTENPYYEASWFFFSIFCLEVNAHYILLRFTLCFFFIDIVKLLSCKEQKLKEYLLFSILTFIDNHIWNIF